MRLARSLDTGGVFLLPGSPSGLTGRGSVLITQNSKGAAGTAGAYDLFGHQVSLLDHDGDGRAELVAGVPGKDSENGAVTFARAGSGSTMIGSTALGVRGKKAQFGGWIGR